jgi:hypothetical protein
MIARFGLPILDLFLEAKILEESIAQKMTVSVLTVDAVCALEYLPYKPR